MALNLHPAILFRHPILLLTMLMMLHSLVRYPTRPRNPPLLHAREHAIVALRLSIPELLRIPLLHTLCTLPPLTPAKFPKYTCIQSLILLIRLRPAAKTLVCQLQQAQVAKGESWLVDDNRGLLERFRKSAVYASVRAGSVLGKQSCRRIIVIRVFVSLVLNKEAQDILVCVEGLLEVVSGKRACFLG